MSQVCPWPPHLVAFLCSPMQVSRHLALEQTLTVPEAAHAESEVHEAGIDWVISPHTLKK